MTTAELEKSDTVKALMGSIMGNTMFKDILDAVQRKALPSSGKKPPLVPGVHYDTTLAHDDQYRAGWSDCVEYLRNLATGTQTLTGAPDEEEFAASPEVQAIDEEIKKHQPHQ